MFVSGDAAEPWWRGATDGLARARQLWSLKAGEVVDDAAPGAGPDSEDSRAERAEALTEQLRLTSDEAAVLGVLKLLMAARDVAAASSPSSGPVKLPILRGMVDELRDVVAGDDSASEWRHELVKVLGSVEDPAAAIGALEDVACEAGAEVDRRSRAILVLVELHLFQPWPVGCPWYAPLRRRSLAEAGGCLAGLRPGDNEAVTAELKAVTRLLRRKQVRWGRVAAAGVVGLGVGAATLGLAAPIIGATVGAAGGLSGAAATSAGLAALGGGSIAAGGLGVAGGTAVLAGAGAVAGMGVAAGGARASRWASPGDVALEALKAGVLTRLVVLGEEHDEEKAKRVVQALQARLEQVSAGVTELGARIGRLTEANAELTAESAELRADNERLVAELTAERDRALLAEAALEAVIERIPVDAPRPALPPGGSSAEDDSPGPVAI